MLKRTLAATISALIAITMATGLAHGGSAPWDEPPLEGATAVALLEAKRGSDSYVLQQWDSPASGTALTPSEFRQRIIQTPPQPDP